MHRLKKCSYVVCLLSILFIGYGLIGCAGTQTQPRSYTIHIVEPKHVTPPAKNYSSIAIKRITFTDPKSEWLSGLFYQSVLDSFKTQNAFETVLYPAPETIPETSIVLTGDITEVDRGNKALKMFVGMGAGKSRISGTFKILNSKGLLLAEYDAREIYAHHADLVDLDELMVAFGQTVALSVTNWSQGKSLEQKNDSLINKPD